MANKSNVTLRIEPELKEQAATLFNSLGLDLSTATEIFFRQALRCYGLPFEVKPDEPNEVTYEAMESAEKDEEMFGPFDSVEELMKALNKQHHKLIEGLNTNIDECISEEDVVW